MWTALSYINSSNTTSRANSKWPISTLNSANSKYSVRQVFLKNYMALLRNFSSNNSRGFRKKSFFASIPVPFLPSGWSEGFKSLCSEKIQCSKRFHFFSRRKSYLTPEILSTFRSLRNSSEQSHLLFLDSRHWQNMSRQPEFVWDTQCLSLYLEKVPESLGAFQIISNKTPNTVQDVQLTLQHQHHQYEQAPQKMLISFQLPC